MSDTVKLIVTISKDQYEICKQALKDFGDRPITECEFVIAVGTPLDDVKAELAKPQEIDLGQLMSRSNVGIMRFGFEAYDKGVKHVIELLDNIGKAESEE